MTIKSKTVMSWSPWNKKECISLFCPKEFFKHLCSTQCIVYWINFQNICTFTYQKLLLHTLLLLVLKIVESLQCILKATCIFQYDSRWLFHWRNTPSSNYYNTHIVPLSKSKGAIRLLFNLNQIFELNQEANRFFPIFQVWKGN